MKNNNFNIKPKDMKSKLFSKLPITTLLLISIVLFVAGCENPIERQKETKSKYAKYLHVNVNSLDEVVFSDFLIISEAYSRLDVKTDDYLIRTIQQTSGSQVNISEHTFNLIKKSIEDSNETMRLKFKRRAKTRANYQTRQGPQEKRRNLQENYCVAYALSNMPGGPSFDRVADDMDREFGVNAGVPQESIGSFGRRYFPESYLMRPGDLDSVQKHNSLHGDVLLLNKRDPNTGEIKGHVVNIMFYDSQSKSFLTRDYQKGGHTGVHGTSELYMIFRSTPKY